MASEWIRRVASGQAGWFDVLGDNPHFRRVMMVMTLSWRALVAQSAACGALLFALTIKAYLIVSPIIGYSTADAMTAWSLWYARGRIAPLRRGAEQRARVPTQR